uniref:Uncharacterized protein n=1 Tax=Anguilla anguilla TaxID=7936 RepID=A0A0E9XW24_ANGAN
MGEIEGLFHLDSNKDKQEKTVQTGSHLSQTGCA